MTEPPPTPPTSAAARFIAFITSTQGPWWTRVRCWFLLVMVAALLAGVATSGGGGSSTRVGVATIQPDGSVTESYLEGAPQLWYSIEEAEERTLLGTSTRITLFVAQDLHASPAADAHTTALLAHLAMRYPSVARDLPALQRSVAGGRASASVIPIAPRVAKAIQAAIVPAAAVLLVVALIRTVQRYRERPRPRANICPACGYPLDGLRCAKCPECGWTPPFFPEDHL